MRNIFWLVQIAILAVAGCRSTASKHAPESGWQPVPAGVPTEWRTLHLYSGPCAFILASDESAAAQAHDVAAVARAACFEVLGRFPARGLLIAVSAKDPLLIEDPQTMIGTLQRWNAAATGRDTPPSSDGKFAGDDSGHSVSPALAARLLPGGILKDEVSLALPIPLREHIAHVVLLPTSACLETTCAALIDAAFKESGMTGWLQLQLVKAIANPTNMMVKEMQRLALATLLDVWLVGEEVTSAQVEAILARAGVADVLPKRKVPGAPLPEH